MVEPEWNNYKLQRNLAWVAFQGTLLLLHHAKETPLPSLCPNCGTIFLVEFIQAHNPTRGDSFSVTCNECFEEVRITANIMKGCPLNQAYLFHEDGFNAFTKKTRSIGTIQIASACITKEEWSRGESVQVYSFVPTCYIEEGIVHKMDASLNHS